MPRWLLLTAIVAFGCGDDSMVPADGGDASVDGGDRVIAAPARPEAPMPPDFGACRTGYRVVAGLSVCSPLPSPAPTCAAHEAIFPGDAVCARVGEACGADGFPRTLPASSVIFVRSAASGGDGTRTRPFGTIAEALAVSAPGDTVAIGAGDYVESVPLPTGVTLRGACVEETTIRTIDSVATAPTLEVLGVGSRIENLTITGARPGVRVRGTGLDATLTDVIIDAATTTGISVAAGGELHGTNVVVRGTRSAGAAFGRGINVEFGSTLTLRRGVVIDNRETGIIALEGSTLILEDVHVGGTAAVDGFGDGIGVELGSTATITGCLLTGNAGVGAYANSESQLVISDCLVRDNLQEALQVSGAATASLSRLVVHENGESGVLAAEPGTTVVVSDAVFRGQGHRATATQSGAALTMSRVLVEDNGRARELSALYVNGGEGVASSMTLTDVRIDGHSSTGVQAQAGAELSLIRVAVTETGGTAFNVQTGRAATLRDLSASDTRPDAEGLFGRGLEVGDGTVLDAARLRFDDVREVGMIVWQSTATVSDLSIDEVAAHPSGEYGHGLELQTVTGAFERVRIVRARGTGMLAGTNSDIIASDIEILDTQSNGPFLLSGHALTVNSGAQAEVTRARFVDNREATVAVFEPGTFLTMTQVEILRSLPRQCSDPRCAGFGAGIGLGVYQSGRALVRDFSIIDSALCGVQLADAELDLEDGVIAEGPIGINVQDPSYPFERLTNRVILRDNVRNVDSEGLPVPDPVVPTEM